MTVGDGQRVVISSHIAAEIGAAADEQQELEESTLEKICCGALPWSTFPPDEAAGREASRAVPQVGMTPHSSMIDAGTRPRGVTGAWMVEHCLLPAMNRFRQP